MKPPRGGREGACFAFGLAMLAAVWSLHRQAPPYANMYVFYLLPIGFVSWFCGASWGYAMSAISAAIWLRGDLSTGEVYGQWFIPIPYWNALMHLVLFGVATALSGLIVRLRRLNDLEHEMSLLKSDMVSLVSHEFANSLTTFRLSLTVLQESRPEDEAQRHICCATLQRVYTHLSGAVANFLNLNRIEAGHFVPHVRRTALRTLVHATISQLGPMIEDRKVALHLDLPVKPVVVKADPDALSVVISNLVANAFKYTPPGGAVTVRVAMDPFTRTASVCVADTGIGISKKDQSLITAGYYRTLKGRKTAGGFGVGLKVTRELLEAQGARIKIESQPGRGSSFSFRLPLWDGTTPLPAGRTPYPEDKTPVP